MQVLHACLQQGLLRKREGFGTLETIEGIGPFGWRHQLQLCTCEDLRNLRAAVSEAMKMDITAYYCITVHGLRLKQP